MSGGSNQPEFVWLCQKMSDRHFTGPQELLCFLESNFFFKKEQVMGILGGIQRRKSVILGRELYSLRGESKQKHIRMQMAMLNLSNSSSAKQEHHQMGYLPLTSEWEDNKCYRYSEEGGVFCLLRWSEKDDRGRGGEEYLT